MARLAIQRRNDVTAGHTETHDGIAVNAGDAFNAADAVAFAEQADDLRLHFGFQFVCHKNQYSQLKTGYFYNNRCNLPIFVFFKLESPVVCDKFGSWRNLLA